MTIIKECVSRTKGFHYVIRTNTYANSFEHLNNLVQIARSNFANLKDSSIEVVLYGGSRFKGTMGIEFKRAERHPDYKDINELEITL